MRKYKELQKEWKERNKEINDKKENEQKLESRKDLKTHRKK